MRPASGSPAPAEFMQLPLPIGGTERGPGIAPIKRDLSDRGPGGSRFVYLEEKNLVPTESGSAVRTRIPGPGEPGFTGIEEKNMLPGEASDAGKTGATKRKMGK